MQKPRRQRLLIVPLIIGIGTTAALAFIDPATWLTPEHPAIDYWNAPLTDPVTRLEKKLQNGEATLSYARSRLGYLPSLLHNLNINADSQIRVFSKTSFRPLVLWLFCYYPVGAPGVASPKRTMISVFTSTNIPSRTVGL